MKKALDENFGEDAVVGGISPSAFMRQLRPEHYSDTEQRPAISLSSAALEYHLDTITSRNQTHDFEIFCRKLCERAICPNLRPQTGPDGGGDSKADTETFPIADEVAELTYVGQANSGRERWGFAFSAKSTWADKVRKDVKGIIDTGRIFDRIICVTSRFAKAKDRARIEDELTTQYGVPVTIHDRSWIVSEIVEKGRTDIAFNYLKIGDISAAEVKLGPTDYSRKQQLEDIEGSLANPDAFQNMEMQRVTEALVAAKLSRGLERPRIETDGRFNRAIRLADKHGTYRQKLETRYEKIWTAFWWYDDFELLNASYDDFQSRALESEHAKNLEFLGNLNQLLVNTVMHRYMTADACQLNERTASLRDALYAIANNPDRPNNSLEARMALARIKLSAATMAADDGAFSDIWTELAGILNDAAGLGEFDADGLIKFVEVVGSIAGNDPAYNNLIEKLSEFVASRKSEAEGALILLRRAEKLDFENNLDMIRWLGKAIVGLTKKEYSEPLIHAAQILTLAYRSARLPWAARATCTFAMASSLVEADQSSDVPVGVVPTMKIWGWIALELSHLPDFLFAIQLLNGFLAGLPLAESSKAKVCDDICELDAALGCLFLNCDIEDLRKLESVPDILEGLSLFMARTALLFALGYKDVLRADGSLPAAETDEAVDHFLSLLKGQPVARQCRRPLILNECKQVFATTVLGMEIAVEIGSEGTILVAEAVLGSLEAFFATVIGQDVVPHTQSLRMQIIETEGDKPSIDLNELDMSAIIMWPRELPITQYDRQPDVCSFLLQVGTHVLAATCMVKEEVGPLIERLMTDEAVNHRVMMIVAAGNAYRRVVSSPVLQLSKWQQAVRRSYPMREGAPKLQAIQSPPQEDAGEIRAADDKEELRVANHQAMKISSVIDVHTWDRAQWRGCGYLQIGHDSPPVMALLFENALAGRKIFERWRERFGACDRDEEIALSIIRNLPDASPHHYCVQITSKIPGPNEDSDNRLIFMAARSMIMEPSTDNNLELFLSGYRRFGAYFLVPATGSDVSGFSTDLSILKRSVSVKSAADVGEHDIEALAMRMRGMPIAS